jgi:hypothetical protein
MQIYSAIINGYDEKLKGGKVFEEQSNEPHLRSRWYKMHPHVLFPDADFTLWIDGNIEIIGKITEIIDFDILVFKHSRRNCVYEEAAIVINQFPGITKKVYEQVFKYTQEGYPANNGLYECPVILRKNSEKVNEFNEAWWNEINTYSKRDQISFAYLVKKMGLKVGTFEGSIENNSVFKKHPHRGMLNDQPI